MNYNEALISCIIRDNQNLAKLSCSGLLVSDIDPPYSEILADALSNKSISVNYVKLKYNIDIDIEKYADIYIDDVINELLKIKKQRLLSIGFAELSVKLKNTSIDKFNPASFEEELLELYLKVNRLGHRDRIANGNEVLKEAIDRYEKIKNGNIKAVAFGLTNFDNLTGGMWEGELVSIVARPQGYKTTFMTLLLCDIAFRQRKKCLWINTEMRNVAIMNKILFMRFGFNLTGLRKGTLTITEESNLHNLYVSGNVDMSNIIFAGSFKMSVDDLITIAIANKPDVIFVDSAYILRNTYKEYHERVAETIDILKQLALDLNCVVIFTHQLNREAVGRGKNRAIGGEYISLETIGYSDRVACNTDFVLALYQSDIDYVNKQLSIKPLKIRDSERVGEFKLDWRFGSQDFGKEILGSVQDLNTEINVSDKYSDDF